MISIKDGSKKYNKFFALEDVNLAVEKCLIYAFVGPNGSGKTTLMNVILNICFLSKGRIHLNELDQINMGSAIGDLGFFERFSIKRNLQIISCIRNSSVGEIDDYLKLFDLFDIRFKAMRKLSEGMRQKVSLIAAFLGNPKLIVLDEPTNQLDIDAQLILRDLIAKAKTKGVTVFITSHILDEIEKTSDYIYFMKSGKIVSSDIILNYKLKYNSLENAYKEIIH